MASIVRALLEAATDAGLPDANHEDCWHFLRWYLRRNKVDITARNRDEWLKSFNRYRKAVRKYEKAFIVGRSSSTESGKISDIGSVTDSGYKSSSPYDSNYQTNPKFFQDVYALVAPYEEGDKEPLCILYSDETEEGCIIQAAVERLNLKKDEDGKGAVVWLLQGGGKTSWIKCTVVPDCDGLADMVFTTKAAERKGERELERKYSDTRDSIVSRDASKGLQSSSDNTITQIIASLFGTPELHSYNNNELCNLGHKMLLLVTAAQENVEVRPPVDYSSTQNQLSPPIHAKNGHAKAAYVDEEMSEAPEEHKELEMRKEDWVHESEEDIEMCMDPHSDNGEHGKELPSLSRPTFDDDSTAHCKSEYLTDSTCSEDATDWEESDNGDGFPIQIGLLGKPPLDRGLKDLSQVTQVIIQKHLSPAKRELVERLMEEFWVIFNQNWKGIPLQRGSTSPPGSGSGSTTSRSGSPKPTTSSTTKRSRDNGDDEDQDESSGRGVKRFQNAPKAPDISDNPGIFACPFRKHNPKKYSVKEWRICALTGYKSVARLKAHLYRKHLIHWCQRCKGIFDTEKELDDHIEAPQPCEYKASEPLDGITRKMREQLQCRRKEHSGQTEAESWRKVYKILFPGEENVPHPYFEPVREQDDEVHVPQSPSSRELANYNEYLRRVTPQYVRSALETVVNTEIQPLEERLRELLPGLIVEAQSHAFSSYQAMTSSSRDAESNPLDSNQQTSLDTFYQPPPDQVQAEQFSEFRIPHQNAGDRGPPDSPSSSDPSGLGLLESTTLDSASSNTTVTSDISAQLASETHSMSINMPDLPHLASLAVSGEILVNPHQAQRLPSIHGEQVGEESTPSRESPASYNANYGGNGSSQDYGFSHEPILLDECYTSQQDMNIIDSFNLDDIFGKNSIYDTWTRYFPTV